MLSEKSCRNTTIRILPHKRRLFFSFPSAKENLAAHENTVTPVVLIMNPARGTSQEVRWLSSHKILPRPTLIIKNMKLKEKEPLYIVPWRCTFACDSNCAHCASAGKPPFHDEVDTSRALRIVDQVYDFGASFFGITGGEPLLRKDLFEIVRYAKKDGFKRKHNNRRTPPRQQKPSRTSSRMKSAFNQHRRCRSNKRPDSRERSLRKRCFRDRKTSVKDC